MPLYSAVDDLALKTLANVPGVLGKLRYLSGLRGEDGGYHHWGLERTHGQRPAREALESTHKQLVLRVLRMPLDEVLHDAAISAAAADLDLRTYIAQIRGEADKLVPADIAGGSVQHFSSILQALGSLAQTYRDANLQAS